MGFLLNARSMSESFRPAEKKTFPDGRVGDNMMIVVDVFFFTSMNL